jgi:hypothetical protein
MINFNTTGNQPVTTTGYANMEELFAECSKGAVYRIVKHSKPGEPSTNPLLAGMIPLGWRRVLHKKYTSRAAAEVAVRAYNAREDNFYYKVEYIVYSTTVVL